MRSELRLERLPVCAHQGAPPGLEPAVARALAAQVGPDCRRNLPPSSTPAGRPTAWIHRISSRFVRGPAQRQPRMALIRPASWSSPPRGEMTPDSGGSTTRDCSQQQSANRSTDKLSAAPRLVSTDPRNRPCEPARAAERRCLGAQQTDRPGGKSRSLASPTATCRTRPTPRTWAGRDVCPALPEAHAPSGPTPISLRGCSTTADEPLPQTTTAGNGGTRRSPSARLPMTPAAAAAQPTPGTCRRESPGRTRPSRGASRSDALKAAMRRPAARPEGIGALHHYEHLSYPGDRGHHPLLRAGGGDPPLPCPPAASPAPFPGFSRGSAPSES